MDDADADDPTLSIGELADRTGVAVTALRYYDELGLVRPTVRLSGRRRYAQAAVRHVDLVRFLQAVGMTLADVEAFVTGTRAPRQAIIDRKLTEIAEQQERLAVARELLEHGRDCPAGDPMECPRFWSIVDGQPAPR